MDWSLLGCGHHGHVTYAPAEIGMRKRLIAQTASGEAWRCLRCGGYVTGEPLASGPAAQAPAVRRGKEVRSAFILRIFAVERFLRGLAAGVLAFVVWRFAYSRESLEQAFNRERPILRSLFQQFGYNIDNSKLVGTIQHALTLSPTAIKLVSAGLAVYTVIELIEAIGLWLYRRWGEYFAMVATSLGLPYEIYDLVDRVTVPRVIFFAVNLALVLYLVITKRLFGVRGGKHAYEARLRSESILQSAIIVAAAERAAAPDRSVPAGTAASAAAFQAAGAAAAAGNPAPPGAPAAGAPAAENPEPAGTAEAGTARLPRAGQDSDPGSPPIRSRSTAMAMAATSSLALARRRAASSAELPSQDQCASIRAVRSSM